MSHSVAIELTVRLKAKADDADDAADACQEFALWVFQNIGMLAGLYADDAGLEEDGYSLELVT